jgi:hypothetical protein
MHYYYQEVNANKRPGSQSRVPPSKGEPVTANQDTLCLLFLMRLTCK